MLSWTSLSPGISLPPARHRFRDASSLELRRADLSLRLPASTRQLACSSESLLPELSACLSRVLPSLLRFSASDLASLVGSARVTSAGSSPAPHGNQYVQPPGQLAKAAKQSYIPMILHDNSKPYGHRPLPGDTGQHTVSRVDPVGIGGTRVMKPLNKSRSPHCEHVQLLVTDMRGQPPAASGGSPRAGGILRRQGGGIL